MRIPYCESRFSCVRRRSRTVMVGAVGIGGDHPIRIQSMTTTPTLDVAATVRQSRQLAEAGCEIVRITAQNVAAAKALRDIRAALSRDKISVPLVADIHFLPSAAMEAVNHVEKVRINPGNYADKKKFTVREYSDAQYEEELQRLYEAFSPIVLRCRELGKAMRIGTNHGSLSDRIMNRYGDTPLGMVESALEFLRIAESHGYQDIVLSMKASNPKIMIQAYRLMVARMLQEDMHYPLHLGVTEAGDGDDARIKSAMGIGGLLLDGLGDTIRVSLTEDPVFELPVARQLADKAMLMWRNAAYRTEPDPIDPFSYTRRAVVAQKPGGKDSVAVGSLQPQRVLQPAPADTLPQDWLAALQKIQNAQKEAAIEGLLIPPGQCVHWLPFAGQLRDHVGFCVWPVQGAPDTASSIPAIPAGDIILVECTSTDASTLSSLHAWAGYAAEKSCLLAVDARASLLPELEPSWRSLPDKQLIFTDGISDNDLTKAHPAGRYRQLAETLSALNCRAPIWLRCTSGAAIEPGQTGFGDRLLEASLLAGVLLCDGIGDYLSIETVPDVRQSTTLAYNILQGARCRSTKTEFVACPSCGRTLFDLQTTTQRIRAATGHLKGVTIAVMGCIVNGPGEMADADFGYVGGAPGKINLYVGKECVQYHIPSEKAVEALITLIQQHGKWQDPA